MKPLVLALVAFGLTACSKKEKLIPVTVETTVYRSIPTPLLDCRLLPLDQYDADKITENEIATILYGYDYNLRNCYNDVQSIKKLQPK